jgi:Protein of unknown function (DUF3592)
LRSGALLEWLSVASFPRLSRYFRFYVKKRGERRTGSKRAGSAGLTAFFGALCGLGLMIFVITWTTLAWPEWKANQQFRSVEAEILEWRRDVRYVRQFGETEITGYRPKFKVKYSLDGTPPYNPEITWDVAGTYFSDRAECEAIHERYPVGSHVTCWYDRENPERAVLILGYSGYVWLILVLPVAFILVGGGGVLYMSFNRAMSAERRKDLARRAAQIAPRDPGLLAGLYPGVPSDTGLTNSPGTRLTYRLPAAHLGGWSLAIFGAGSLVFCGMVAFLPTLAVLKAADGETNWSLIVAGLLFVPAALWLLYVCLKRLTQAVHLGHTVLEISRQPLYPGAECQVSLAQFGRLAIRRLRLALVCQEKATYQQGTNTRTETRQVAEHEIFRGDDLLVSPQRPLEVQRSFQVPPTAMHSFRAPRNEITWMLVVEALSDRWPLIRRDFPLVVYPSRTEVA